MFFFIFRKHLEEAKAAGVADIIDLDMPSEDELEKELLHLEREQEKLIAELRKAYQDELAAETDGRRAALDEEMERRAREMNILNQPGAEEQLNDLRNVCCDKISNFFIHKSYNSHVYLLS